MRKGRCGGNAWACGTCRWWIRAWSIRWAAMQNSFAHVAHLYGFLPVWMFMWSPNSLSSVNAMEHILQCKTCAGGCSTLSFVCLSTCTFKLSASVKVLKQKLHLYMTRVGRDVASAAKKWKHFRRLITLCHVAVHVHHLSLPPPPPFSSAFMILCFCEWKRCIETRIRNQNIFFV